MRWLHAVLLVMLITGGTFCLWIPQQRKLTQARLALERAQVHRGEADDRVSSASALLEILQRELNDQREKTLGTKVAAKRVEEELAEPVPDDPWVKAPPAWPDWDARSPYVWLSKKLLPNVGMKTFTASGELQPEIAKILSLTESQRRRLNGTVACLLTQFHELESAHAERSETPSRREGESARITVQTKSMPEEAARFQQEFDASLRTELGNQRTELLLTMAKGWIHSELSDFGTVARTISVNRRADGMFETSIETKSPLGSGSSSSTSSSSGMATLDGQIPAHLLPFFADLQQFQPQGAK